MSVDYSKIRLDPKEIQIIIASFKHFFTPTDHLWIFGSRVDLNKKGGDIDLYIEVEVFCWQHLYTARQNFWIILNDKLGEQKIDIVIRDPKQDLLIYQVARDTGIKLI